MSSPVQVKLWEEGKANSRLNGEQPLFVALGYEDLRSLEGKLLTLIDASFSDAVQRKAFKDIVRQTIWWHWVPGLDHGPNAPSVGMPLQERN